jgi:hypothetical protein
MHLVHVLPQVIFPHGLQCGASEVASRDTALEWVIKGMTTTGIHSDRCGVLLYQIRCQVLGVAIVLETDISGVTDG